MVSIALVAIYLGLRDFLTYNMVAGVYVNHYNGSRPTIADMPDEADTLVLFQNGKFHSGFYGKGTYQLDYSMWGTSINIQYEYEMGRAALNASINKPLFGEPRIMLVSDLDYYYIRVKD